MNQSFINQYQQLLPSTVELQPMSGLWLVQGDEPLLSQWLIDALRPHWQKYEQVITRIELTSAKSWWEVLAELDGLLLFSSASAIIVTGNHKPDKEVQQALLEFATRCRHEQQTSQQQNQPLEIQHHLVWLTNKQDKRALSSKWAHVFNKEGMIIDCNVYNEQQRQQILTIYAQRFNVQLTNDAWQLLMLHTHNNLLNAYQTLWRLSFLDLSENIIDIPTLQTSLVSQAHYSVFDLSDAMLSANVEQVVVVINALQATNEPETLVLWTISKDMKLIQQLHTGKDPQTLGIWKSKQRLYLNASSRLEQSETGSWAELLFNCDRAVKGLINQSTWRLLLQASLAVAGVNIL